MRIWTQHMSAIAATACLAIGPAGATNLLNNGSFETPGIAANSYVTYASGSTAITGWTAVGPGEIQLSNDPACTGGFQCIDLTGIYGYDKGLRSDPVTTAVGATYLLTFDLGNYVPFGSSTVSVSINNGAPMWFTNPVNADPSNFEWEIESLNWVADAPSAQVTILGVANGGLSNNAGILLDNVRFELAPVPEPSSYALLLAGLGLVGGLMRRRLPRG